MKKKSKCKHCNIEFDLENKKKGWMANHSRWCDKNPKLNEYKIEIQKLGRNCNETNETKLKRSKSLSEAWKN